MSSTVANLPSGAPAADTDIVYTVKDPSGTPSDSKLALSDIKDYVLAGGGGGGAVGPTGAIQFSDGSGNLSASSDVEVLTSAGTDYAPVDAKYINLSTSTSGWPQHSIGAGGSQISSTSGTVEYYTIVKNAQSYFGTYDSNTSTRSEASVTNEGFWFLSSVGTDSALIKITGPSAVTNPGADLTFTFPGTTGIYGQSLTTDGSGNLYWSDPAQNNAPATASSTGRAGEIRYDSSYVYVCVATNTWKRAALSTW